MSQDLSKKTLKIQKRAKKNKLIIGVSIAGFVSVIVAMFTQIDVESAMKAQADRFRVYEKPNVEEGEDQAQLKQAWAIKTENDIQNMKRDNKEAFTRMTEDLKKQIVESNALTMTTLKKEVEIAQGKVEELRSESAMAKKRLEAELQKAQGEISRLKHEMDDGFSNVDRAIESSKVENDVLMPPPLISKPENTDGLFGDINVGRGTDNVAKAPQSQSQPKKRQKSLNYEIVSLSNDLSTVEDVNGTQKELTEEELKKQNTYTVATGFTEGYLITGAYAPLFEGGTGGSSGGEAVPNVPVLIEMTGDLLMPNDTIGSVDKCMVLGTTKGNASARVIDIRTDKMTCLLDGGKKIIEGKLKGYVVNEAGTPGLPAVMVYRAGEFLSRMIGAGLLESLSSAFVASASSNSNGLGGSTNFYGAATQGVSNGMNNAFTKLSDFYLQLAEQTLPVLEAKPGRFVSIVISGGDTFELKDVKLLDTRDVESYLNDFIGDEYASN